MSAEVLPCVVADLEARVAKGAVEYGERLRFANGRDALLDAYEEALDLCLYLRQALGDRESSEGSSLPDSGGVVCQP